MVRKARSLTGQSGGATRAFALIDLCNAKKPGASAILKKFEGKRDFELFSFPGYVSTVLVLE